MFDVATGRRRRAFGFDGRIISDVAFSPNGRTLAAAIWPESAPRGGNGDAVFFDVATGRVRARLPVTYYPNGIAYAQGGNRVVTLNVSLPAIGDSPGASSLQVWDARTLRAIGVPVAIPAAAHSLDASSDGRRVTHGSAAGFAVVWDLDPGRWEALACRIAGRALTHAEWHRYLPGRDYEPACDA
jgi:hypothetical protein